MSEEEQKKESRLQEQLLNVHTAPFGVTPKIRHMAKKIIPTILSTSNPNLIGNHEMQSTLEESLRGQDMEDSFVSHMSSSSLITPVTGNQDVPLSRAQRSLLGNKRRK